MKKLFVLTILLFALQLGFSQNILSRDFGSSYASVKEFLQSRNYVSANYDQPEVIQATTGDLHVTYYFASDKLYKMQVCKTFDNKKDARTAAESFRTYFSLKQADLLDLAETEEQTYFAAIKGRELNEITLLSLDKNRHQVKQMSLNMDLMPIPEMEDMQQGNLKLLAFVHTH